METNHPYSPISGSFHDWVDDLLIIIIKLIIHNPGQNVQSCSRLEIVATSQSVSSFEWDCSQSQLSVNWSLLFSHSQFRLILIQWENNRDQLTESWDWEQSHSKLETDWEVATISNLEQDWTFCPGLWIISFIIIIKRSSTQSWKLPEIGEYGWLVSIIMHPATTSHRRSDHGTLQLVKIFQLKINNLI
jgi:hypothetical protein